MVAKASGSIATAGDYCDTISRGAGEPTQLAAVKMRSGKKGKPRVFMVFNAFDRHLDITRLFLLIVAGIQPRFGPSNR